ncbi:hypothetical protein BDR26DRAFT_923965 [Obelidium mucronatum]|nr:hypothetical protein BDR26DRAFT_923965 [Obelidium mucronatum]
MQRTGSIKRSGSIRRGNAKPTINPKTYDMLDGLLSTMGEFDYSTPKQEEPKPVLDGPVAMERIDTEVQDDPSSDVDVLGTLLASQPPMIGVLSKLFKQGTEDGWKSRFFVFTKAGKLVVFKSNSSMANTAIASLPVTSCSAGFDEVFGAWVLTVLGDSMGPSGHPVKRKWTLKGQDAATLKIWAECINEVVGGESGQLSPVTTIAQAQPTPPRAEPTPPVHAPRRPSEESHHAPTPVLENYSPTPSDSPLPQSAQFAPISPAASRPRTNAPRINTTEQHPQMFSANGRLQSAEDSDDFDVQHSPSLSFKSARSPSENAGRRPLPQRQLNPSTSDQSFTSATGRAFSPPRDGFRGLPTSPTGRGVFVPPQSSTQNGINMRRDGSERGRAGYNQHSSPYSTPENNNYYDQRPSNEEYDSFSRPIYNDSPSSANGYQNPYDRPSQGSYGRPSPENFQRPSQDGGYYGRPSQETRQYGRPSPENFQMAPPTYYDQRDPSPAQRKRVGFNV